MEDGIALPTQDAAISDPPYQLNTRGGQSVKLGLVEVVAYDAEQIVAVIKEADAKTSAEREQLQRIEQSANAAYKKLSESQGPEHGKWLNALRLEEKAQRRRAYLTSSFYYSKSFPPELAHAKTDADGRFHITVPNKNLSFYGPGQHERWRTPQRLTIG